MSDMAIYHQQDFHRPSFRCKNIRVSEESYPDVVDATLVGTYSPLAKAGGGYVWDEVLEYRVWCHPERGSTDFEEGSDYYYAFATYAEAFEFSQNTQGAETPLALIRQCEYIAELNPGEYRHVKEVRIAEWPVEFLHDYSLDTNEILKVP
jgi:hypothetical protein